MTRNYPRIGFGLRDGYDGQSLYFFPGSSTARAVAVHLTGEDEAALLDLLLHRDTGSDAGTEGTVMFGTRIIDNSAGSDDNGGSQYINLRGLKPAGDWDTQTFLARRRAAGRRIADMNGGRTRGSRRNRSSDD